MPKREYADPIVKVLCAAIPAIGTHWAIDNQLIAIVVSVLEASVVLLGFRFVSKITVPQAFALGYFSSFLEPSAYALGHGGRAHYKTRDGHHEVPLKAARVHVALPDDLDVEEGQASPRGLFAVLKRIQSKCIPGELFVGEGEKSFGVYLDLADPKQPLIVDVPNNLRALREFVLRETADVRASRRKSQASAALSEYAAMLEQCRTRERDRLAGRVEIVREDELK